MSKEHPKYSNFNLSNAQFAGGLVNADTVNAQQIGGNIEKHIALISVNGDPAIEIGKEEAGGQNVYVRQMGEALAKLGWQVDMYTRKASLEQEVIVQHSDNCRTIRLQAGPIEFVPRDEIFQYLPEFVNNFLRFQMHNSIVYQLIYTHYWLSSWVAMQLKNIQGTKYIHTYYSLKKVEDDSTIKNSSMMEIQRLAVEKDVLETAEIIVAINSLEKQDIESLVSTKDNIEIISNITVDEVAKYLNKRFTQPLRKKPISDSDFYR